MFGDAFVESRLDAREDRVTRNDDVARSHVPSDKRPPA